MMRRKLSLKDYALWLLGAREYSVQRLTQKCQERYPEQLTEIDLLIKKFIQEKYLDDQRFCEVMIRSELRKGNGKMKIVQKLIQKGIDHNLAKQQCELLIATDDLFEPALLLVEKKREQLKRKSPDLAEYELNAKLTQYLASRGYDYGLIKEVLNKAG